MLSQLGQKPGSDYINASFVDVSDLDYLLAVVTYCGHNQHLGL